MSLPGKTMKIGGYNYHISDQGSGDKIAFLVHSTSTPSGSRISA